VNEIQRLIDIQKKNKKNEDTKRREAEERERRYERNKERLQRLEKVSVSNGRVEKLRSRKPMKIKFMRRHAPTDDELDFRKYVLVD